ncbi:hypothetical protein M9458_020632, partial [Cirrhinus mrigala]
FFRARIEDVLCPIPACTTVPLLFVCHASILFFTPLHFFLIFIIIINLLAESVQSHHAAGEHATPGLLTAFFNRISS